jgi:proline iminopeptidase
MSELPLSPGRHVLLVDGLPQVYHVAGAGPVCVAQSGGPGVVWEYLRSPELERTLTMVYVEPIGTGDSARLPFDDEGYSLDRYVRQVDGLVGHIGGPTHVLGHSHGGFVMQRYAIRHPERVAGLISYDSSPRWDSETSGYAGDQLTVSAQRLSHRPEIKTVVQAWQDGFTPTDDGFTSFIRTFLPGYFADYWADEARLGPLRDAIRAWHVPGGLAAFDDRDALRQVRVPTLVLTGRFDFICGPRWADEMRTAMPAARFVTFDHSGHMPHLEEPELFAATVSEFVMAAGKS